MADVWDDLNERKENQPGKQLSEATDQLNASVLRAESALVALGLGVSAYVDLWRSPPRSDGSTEYRGLSFKKIDRAWRLAYTSGTCGDFEASWADADRDQTDTLLTHTSREIRVEAVKHLPALHKALLAESERQLAEVKQATAATEAFIASLKTGAP